MLLRGANLPQWGGELAGGPLLVGATLPEETHFMKNGLGGRGRLVLPVILSGFLHNILGFRGLSP